MIHRPLREVFDFVADPKNLPRWQRNVLKSEQISRGPMAAGAAFRQALDVGGGRVEFLCKVTDYEKDVKLSFAYAWEGISVATDFYFEPTESSTILTGRGTGRLQGFYSVFEPLVQQEVGEQVEANLSDLKGFLEGRPTNA